MQLWIRTKLYVGKRSLQRDRTYASTVSSRNLYCVIFYLQGAIAQPIIYSPWPQEWQNRRHVRTYLPGETMGAWMLLPSKPLGNYRKVGASSNCTARTHFGCSSLPSRTTRSWICYRPRRWRSLHFHRKSRNTCTQDESLSICPNMMFCDG